MGPESGAFDSLLAAACRAPSGDNTQPWRFIVDPDGGRIALQVDETRDRSPMNAGQRMARIAVGAVLENLLRAAEGHGWATELELASLPELAAVRLTRRDSVGAGVGAIPARVTNRRPYDGRPVPAEVLDQLGRETPPLDGVRTHWIVDRDRLKVMAELIGAADALMFSEPSMRRAFLSKVRFDAAPTTAVDEGLSLGSLELSGSDRLALRAMRYLPDWVLTVAGAGRAFAAKARRLVESASGLCLVAAPDGAEGTDLKVGRVVQRAWLALTDRGLAAQPMMSLMVLENAIDHGSPALVAALGRDRVAALGQRFRGLIPEVGRGRPAFLLRFGHAPAPSGLTGRLPLPAVTARAAPRDSIRQGRPESSEPFH
jgi:nitroreductase